ncbi:hypothetical protein ACSBR1_020410 [Camellia fascicularis]
MCGCFEFNLSISGSDAGDAVMARWLQSTGLQHLASPLASAGMIIASYLSCRKFHHCISEVSVSVFGFERYETASDSFVCFSYVNSQFHYSFLFSSKTFGSYLASWVCFWLMAVLAFLGSNNAVPPSAPSELGKTSNSLLCFSLSEF